MRDPHVHVENTPLPGFGNAAMRELITRATGLACDLPKTVGTGCGKRRPIAATSFVPERVTCLACRDYGAAEQLRWAELAELAIAIVSEPYANGASPEELAEAAREHRTMAARYGPVSR
ncbi:MAG: hypothetical protein ACLQFR_02715 [Streptosporangiaceae bacterium]